MLSYPVREKALVVIALLLIAFLLCFLEYKRSKQFVSPLLWFYTFWIIISVVARVDMHVYELNSTWNTNLMAVVTISSVSFFGFYLLSDNYIRRIKTSSNQEKVIWNSLCDYVLICSLCISICFYMINVIACNGVPQLSSNIDYHRRIFVHTLFFVPVNLGRYAFSFVPVLLKNSISNKRKYVVIVLTSLILVCEALTGWRTYVFQSVIMLVSSQMVLISATSKKEEIKSFRRTVGLSLSALVFIGYVAATRGRLTSIKRIIEYTFQTIYLYFAPSFLNFQTTMSIVVPKGYLFYTLECIWSLWISPDNMPGFENLNANIGAFNVGTYLLQPYADLGILGVVFWNSIIACVSVWSYSKAKSQSNLLGFVGLGVCNNVIFTMHNGFFLRSSSILVWVIMGIIYQKISIYQGRMIRV